VTPFVFSVVLVGLFALVTYGLSVIGMRKTTDLRSFAVGKGDMSPVLAGVTMAASIASTATFVINPGFVYKDGLSAWAHYGLGAMLGLICALVLLSAGFQKLGNEVGAVTMPAWIRARYGSKALGLFFAGITLFYISFVVLILGGSALIVGGMFGVSEHTALVALLLFCFGYVLMGGTYAHAYTNAAQGVLMMIIALVVFFSGAEHLGPGMGERMAAVSESWSSWLNPESDLYYSFFSVFVSSFLITFALMLQPHIVTKVLYLKEDKRQMRTFLTVAIGASLVFSLMLFVGLYARMDGLEVARQDAVVVAYIQQAFNPYVVMFIFVSLLAAGMSTLDGILVSISSIVVADLVLATGGEGALARRGLSLSRWTVVIIGLISLALAWDPPARLGLFAQQGVYTLVAASFAPVVLGIVTKRAWSARQIGTMSLTAVGVHFALRWGADIVNPSVSASIGILSSMGLAVVFALFASAEAKAAGAAARVS
jgi:SSS family solute:Na+ symporter/sodium/pantothenate symporter